MLYRRNLLYRKKIVGGSILGNVLDVAKNVLKTGSKMVLDKGKDLLRLLGTQKALDPGERSSQIGYPKSFGHGETTPKHG